MLEILEPTPKNIKTAHFFTLESKRIELDEYVYEKKLEKKAQPKKKTIAVKNIKVLKESQATAADLIKENLKKQHNTLAERLHQRKLCKVYPRVS